jgi:hypothetical protein
VKSRGEVSSLLRRRPVSVCVESVCLCQRMVLNAKEGDNILNDRGTLVSCVENILDVYIRNWSRLEMGARQSKSDIYKKVRVV